MTFTGKLANPRTNCLILSKYCKMQQHHCFKERLIVNLWYSINTTDLRTTIRSNIISFFIIIEHSFALFITILLLWLYLLLSHVAVVLLCCCVQYKRYCELTPTPSTTNSAVQEIQRFESVLKRTYSISTLKLGKTIRGKI